MDFLSTKDLKMAIELMGKLEDQITLEAGLRRISGGFAVASLYGADKDNFFVRLRYGVQSDCENNVTTELVKLDRKTGGILQIK